MSVVKGQKIKLNEVSTYMNESLRDKIYNSIAYSKENISSVTTESTLTQHFKNKSEVRQIVDGDISAIGNKIKIGDISSVISTFSTLWKYVRHTKLTHLVGQNNNGKAITYRTDVLMDDIAYVDSNIDFDTTSGIPIKGTIIKASEFTNYITSLYNRWNTAKETMVTWSYTTCHTNCHSSCHGSGGWR